MSLGDDKILSLGAYAGKDQVVHFTDYLARHARSGKKMTRFGCGFKQFDAQIGGLETGEVAVVTGYAKNGKTLFAESWLRSMTILNPTMNPVIFSFELQPERLLAKYAADPTHPVYLPLELRTMDFDWLYDRCVEAKVKHQSQAILVDHLHFLVDMNTKMNMSLNIGAFMRRLKHEVALGLNLAVILIAHQGQPKEGQEASFGGMRDSSFIGQESDMTIIVSRRKDLDAVEAKEYESRGVDRSVVQTLMRDPTKPFEDKYTAHLATVRIAVARRSGTYDWAKLFRKAGNFVEEV